MMSSNFSSVALLGNLPITLDTGNGFIILHMPTIADEYSSKYDIGFFLGICSKSLTELKKELNLPNLLSKYDLILNICQQTSDLSLGVIYALNLIIQDFEYVTDSFRSGNTIISEEIFEDICNYIAVAIGTLDIKDLKTKLNEKTMTPEERAWEERKRMNEAKIRKSKNKNGKLIELDTIISCVCYEFNIPIRDIVQMNKYSVYFLYHKIGNIMNYEVTKIASGTGNLGSKHKHKYWTD